MPSTADFHNHSQKRARKAVANFADVLIFNKNATDAERFLHRASRKHRHLLLSSEGFDEPNTSILTLKSWLTPWRAYVVVSTDLSTSGLCHCTIR